MQLPRSKIIFDREDEITTIISDGETLSGYHESAYDPREDFGQVTAETILRTFAANLSAA